MLQNVKGDFDQCMPPCLDLHNFTRTDHLAEPMPHMDNHYKPFVEVFGTVTSEEYMPSLKRTKYKKHNIPFNPLQNPVNAHLTAECAKCNKLIYLMKKMTAKKSSKFK